MPKNILAYIVSFALLLTTILFFNRAYNEMSIHSELANRHNAVHSSFQNLSKEINNAAVLNPDFIKAGVSTKELNPFFTDSLEIATQLELLKSLVKDSINIKLAKALDTSIHTELSWIVNSNVPDSIIHHKAPKHIASFLQIDSLLNQGINRTNFLITYRTSQVNKKIEHIRLWMIVFALVSVLLLLYTTTNLFVQQSKRKSKEKELATVLNRISDGVLSINNDWRYTFLNDAALAAHPLGKQETIGKIIWEVHPALEGTVFGSKYHEAMETRKVAEIESYYSPLDAWFSVRIYPSEDGLTVFYKNVTESKKAEQQLSKSLKEITDYKFALDESSIVAITDQRGIIKHANENFCKISKYTSDELIGQDHRIINSGYHSKEFIKGLWTTIAHGKIWKGELKNKAKDGSIYWVDTTIVPFLDEKGKPYQYVAIRADITERKLVEESLLNSLKEIADYKFAIDESSIVAITDQRGIITHANQNFCKISKYTSDELIGQDHRIINSGYHSKEFIKGLWTTIAHGKIWKGELKNKAKDGTIYWVDTTIVPFVNDEGKPYQYVAIRADITERKLVEESLLNSLKEIADYKFAIDESSIVAITDQKGIIKHANQNFCKISKYTIDELIGQDHRIINSGHHPKDFIKGLWTTIANGKIWKGELKNKAKDGTIYWVDTTIVPFLDEKGKPYQYVAIRSDITDRKKLEEQQKLSASIINSSDDAILSKNLKGIITSWNHGAEKVFGYEAAEIVGKHISIIIPPHLQHEEDLIIGKISKGDFVEHFETKRITKDGKTVIVSLTISPIKDNEGNIVGASKIARDITLQKEVEEKLAIKEMHFRALIENSAEGITLTDEFSNVIYRSPGSEKITGKLPTENVKSLTHPDDLETIKQKHAELLGKPNIPVEFQGRFLHASGNYIWLEGTFTNLLHVKGVHAIVTNYRNITHRKEAEQKLLSSEKRFRALIENNYDTIALLDQSLNIVYRSPSSIRIIGWTDEEVKNSDSTKHVHPGDLAHVNAIVQQVLANPGKSIELLYRNLHKNGHYVWLEGTLTNLLHDQDIEAIVLNFRDVTERINAERLLAKSEKIYRTIASSIPGSVICLFDESYKYLLVEGDMIAQFGFVKERLLGNKAVDVLPPEIFARFEEKCKLAFEGNTISVERILEGYDVIASFIPLKDEKGEVHTVMTVVINVTELKKAQKDIEELNRGLEEKITQRTAQLLAANRELESFSYSVSHDLRAPLRIIDGFSKILLEDYLDKIDEDGQQHIQVIIRNARKMGQLIDDLLNFSKLGRAEMRISTIYMNKLVEEVLHHLEASGIQVPAKLTIHELVKAHGDNSLIKQVWENLISNAIKYSSKNQEPSIEIGMLPDNSTYYIKDNGAGFDMKYADKLFGVFQRLHKAEEFSGTGVGLALVQRIILRHGGKIWAEAKENEGATFYFNFPNLQILT